MNKRILIVVAGILALMLILASGYSLGSPLFIDNTVEEAFPFEPPQALEIAEMTKAERTELEADFMTAVPDEETVSALAEEQQLAVAQRAESAAEVVMIDKAMVDLSQYQSVVIYCAPFHVVFATATLS